MLPTGASARVDYLLAGRCSSFRATLGPAAGAEAGFVSRQRLLADDAVVADVTLGDGDVRTVSADITGADTLTLRSFALSSAGDGAWGDPEVLCSGRA
jgi:hypothetical protein